VSDADFGHRKARDNSKEIRYQIEETRIHDQENHCLYCFFDVMRRAVPAGFE
jgi:hypothetical protein